MNFLKGFHLYVTTYPYFFNHQTTDCDQSSFHYFWGSYKPAYDPRIIKLTHDLRFVIYDLVVEMNSVIEHAVNAANEELEGEKVHVADGGGWMDAHTWCQEGVHEPDSSIQSTYLFLNVWPDFPIDSPAAVCILAYLILFYCPPRWSNICTFLLTRGLRSLLNFPS